MMRHSYKHVHDPKMHGKLAPQQDAITRSSSLTSSSITTARYTSTHKIISVCCEPPIRSTDLKVDANANYFIFNEEQNLLVPETRGNFSASTFFCGF